MSLFIRVPYIPIKNEDAPKQAGNPWSDEEDQHLIEAFKMEQSTKELAESHGRTSGAIRSRLRKLGLVE